MGSNGSMSRTEIRLNDLAAELLEKLVSIPDVNNVDSSSVIDAAIHELTDRHGEAEVREAGEMLHAQGLVVVDQGVRYVPTANALGLVRTKAYKTKS